MVKYPLTDKQIEKLVAEVDELEKLDLPVHLKEGWVLLRDALLKILSDRANWELLNNGRKV